MKMKRIPLPRRRPGTALALTAQMQKISLINYL